MPECHRIVLCSNVSEGKMQEQVVLVCFFSLSGRFSLYYYPICCGDADLDLRWKQIFRNMKLAGICHCCRYINRMILFGC